MPSPKERYAALRERVGQDPRHPRWLLLVTLTGIFCTSFPTTILSISIRPIAVDLHSTPGTITWVTTAPILAAAVCTPVLGRLGDLRGHRTLFLAGMLVAGLFAIGTALAWNPISLIVFRMISQIGGAATVPSTYAMLFRTFPANERVRASSLASGTLAGASVVGIIIGGPLIDWIGWRPIFFIQAFIALLAFVPALVVLSPNERATERKSIDYLGAVLLAATTFALTFGINRLGAWGVTPVTIGCLVASPIFGWILIQVERRTESPLLPLRVLSARNTRIVVGATFTISIGWMGNFIVTPLLLQSVFGLSAALTSLVTVPRVAGIVLASPVAGRLGVRFGERKLLISACLSLSGVMLLLSFATYTKSLAILIVALSLSGLAFGNSAPALVSAMSHSVTDEDFGLATSLQQTSNQVGAVIGISAFSAIAADSTTPGPFAAVYLGTAALSILAAVIGLGLARRPVEPVTVAPRSPESAD
jgi:MFS family permease